MDRWRGKVAVVTGASSGIGLAIAKELLKEGLIVVGFARRKEKMDSEILNEVNSNNFFARECDVANTNSIIQSFQWIKETFGKLSILINNAGIAVPARIEESDTADLDQVVKVNLLGPLHCTKEAIPLMKENNNEDAQIINVNSILGHKILNIDGLNVYPASKFGLRALSETLSNELKCTNIRVSSISPGLVQTELSKSIWEKYPTIPALEAEDLTSAIIYILAVPYRVEVVDIILEPKGGYDITKIRL